MAHWTADDIPDQSGRVALVTGANSGLGLQTSLALARKGARVLMGCRDAERAAAAVKQIRDAAPSAGVEIVPLDLASLDAVRTASADVLERTDRLDILVNNAGVMAIPRRVTADGYEMQFGTNHLGHFALTGLLLGRLLDTAGSRVVNVSSTAHRTGRMNFDDLHGERSYGKWRAYGQSKLSNLLFTYELQRRLEASGAGAIALAAHPGYSATNLQAVGPTMSGNRVMGFLTNIGNKVIGQSDEIGALPQLYAATSPDARGGQYIGPGGFNEIRGYPKVVKSNARSYDEEAARRLWDISEDLTGMHFDLKTPA